DPPRLDPPDDVHPHVAVQRSADVLGAHRRRDADRSGLVPAAGVEAPGNLPLLVEDVAALLDPAGEEHVTVDPEQVLAVEARLLDLCQRADWLCFPGNGHAGSNCSRSTRVGAWARPPTGFGKNGARPSATGSRSAWPAAT